MSGTAAGGLVVGASPTQLVPGDPDAVEELAARLGGLAGGMATSVSRLGGLDTGQWQGQAAGDFERTLGEIPSHLRQVGNDLADAAGGLRSYATVLRDGQGAAARALALYESGRRRRAAAAAVASGASGRGPLGAGLLLGAGPGGGCRLDDGAYGPGADEIRQAEALLEAARGDLASAARRLAASLRSRAANVPKPVSMWAVPRHQSWEFLKGLGDSVRHTVVSLQKNALWMACPPLAATRQALQFAQTASSSLQHPKEAGKAAIYWDMWQHHPAKAASELTPDVALLLVPELKSQLIAAREARAAQALEDMDNASGGHFFARHGGPDVDRGPTSTSTHKCDTGRCAACFEKRNSLPHPCRSTKGGATSKSDFHIHSADCLQVRHGSDRRRRLPGWRHSIS